MAEPLHVLLYSCSVNLPIGNDADELEVLIVRILELMFSVGWDKGEVLFFQVEKLVSDSKAPASFDDVVDMFPVMLVPGSESTASNAKYP